MKPGDNRSSATSKILDALEPRVFLSAGSEPVVLCFGSQEIGATAVSADGRSGHLLLAGSFATGNDFDPSRHAATTLDAGYLAGQGKHPSDIFSARYTSTGRFRYARDHTTAGDDTPAGFAMTPTFAFSGSSNYDPQNDRR